MNLKDLQTISHEWTTYNFPKAQKWMPLVGAMEELGELSHAHLKQEQNIRQEDFLAKKMDAVGDIIIFLADYCNKNGLDLEQCVELAANDAFQRDWIKYPKNGKTE